MGRRKVMVLAPFNEMSKRSQLSATYCAQLIQGNGLDFSGLIDHGSVYWAT